MSPQPEQQARQTIDAMLAAAGWAVQDYKVFDPTASTGIAGLFQMFDSDYPRTLIKMATGSGKTFAALFRTLLHKLVTALSRVHGTEQVTQNSPAFA